MSFLTNLQQTHIPIHTHTLTHIHYIPTIIVNSKLYTDSLNVYILNAPIIVPPL